MVLGPQDCDDDTKMMGLGMGWTPATWVVPKMMEDKMDHAFELGIDRAFPRVGSLTLPTRFQAGQFDGTSIMHTDLSYCDSACSNTAHKIPA